LGVWVKRIIGVVLGAGVVFFVGTRVYEIQQQQASPKAGKKKGGARIVQVEFTEARVGRLSEELLLTGALKPKEMVDVTPKVTGRLEETHFRIGDLVRAGDLVAQLEDDELVQQVNRASANIEVTRAALSQREAERQNAQAELGRAEQLLKEELISPQDYEARRTSFAVVDAQVTLARAQIEQAEAELRELNIRLSQSAIYSPMTGVVATRYVDVGAVVSPSTPIVRIVNLSTMVTLGNVPERSIGRLRVGNTAYINVDAIPDETFTGRIARISPVLDAATRTALIEIDIPNPNAVLKAEMFARIRLDLGTTREATLIPREGLVYRGQQPGVYVIEGDRPVYRPIETGLTREDQVEVLANLEPGTAIAGRGATMIQEGDRVAPAGDARAKKSDADTGGKSEAKDSRTNSRAQAGVVTDTTEATAAPRGQ
jgi:RND family efflux transporter MFP subunit